MKYLLPFASTGVRKYKKKPRISLIYKAFCFLSRFLSGPLWSGKRDSDPRPQPWQGCALPTELFPHDVSLNASAKVTKISESPNFSRTNPYFLSPHPAVAPPLAAQTGKQKLPSPAIADQIAHAFPFAVLCRKRSFGHPFPRLPKHEPSTSFVFLHGILLEILSL